MNKLFKNLNIQDVFLELLPAFSISLLITEFYYKLGSFTLECVAFLGTWYFAGLLLGKIRKK